MPDQLEKLAPFAVRSGIVITGRPQLIRSQKHLAFVLMTTDLSANSKAELLPKLTACPIIHALASEDLHRLFRLRGTKVVGFKKSSLATKLLSLLRETAG